MVLFSEATSRRIRKLAREHATITSSHRRSMTSPAVLHARRLTSKLLNLHMQLCSGGASPTSSSSSSGRQQQQRKAGRWESAWCLYTNPIYVDDDVSDGVGDVLWYEDCCNNNNCNYLTSSKSTDSGCALDFDELCNGK